MIENVPPSRQLPTHITDARPSWRALLRSLLTCTVLAMLCTSAGAAETTPEKALSWRGDVTTARSLMHDLARAWHKSGHLAMDVEPFSTIAGIDAVVSGNVDIAGSVRPAFPARDTEDDLVFHPVAWDALVMIVHADNPVRDISLNQLHDIYYGKITNWKALGGPDQRIHLYSVASPLDGIEFSMRKYLFRRGNQPVASRRLYINTKQLEAAVALDPWGLGASTLSGVHDNRKLAMLEIDGVAPSLAHIQDGSYPLYEPLYLVFSATSPQAGVIGHFVAFTGSDTGRRVIEANHLLPYDAAELRATQLAQHQVAVQDLSAPRLDRPVAAPGATYAAGAAQAPLSARTLEARQRLAAKRERQAAATEAREKNRQRTEAVESDSASE